MSVSALYSGLSGNFSGSSLLVGKRLPVTAYRTYKWSKAKEGGAENLTQHSSDGYSTHAHSQTLRSNLQRTGHHVGETE